MFPDNTDLGQEWIFAQSNFKLALSVHILLDRRFREHITAAVDV